jgi:SAM-dependent methyltransferase
MDISTISSGLQRADNGIWYGRESAAISYPDDGHDLCFGVEDASFWFRHRNRCIVAAVNAFPPPGGGPIFDIGGGNGFVSAGLAAAGFEVALVEPGPAGAANARKRGIQHVICATTDTAQFSPHSLPAAGLFDVIEHIEDAPAFLRSIRGLLQPGGHLYATVPAYPWLWSQEDVLAGHHRRYTLDSIRATLSDAGFDTLFASSIFRFLPLPILLMRALPYRLGLARRQASAAQVARDHGTQDSALSRLAGQLVGRLLQQEVEQLEQRRPMRFGGSCLVVAKCR